MIETLLVVYACLAISAGLMSWYYIFLPVRNKLIEAEEYQHVYINKYLLSSLVWIVLASIVMPFILYSILSDEEREKFIEYVYEGAK